jgi:hypothetical protein
LIESLKADPVYQRSFQVVPADISIINLNSLVVFQKSINLRFVDELKAQLGSAPSKESVFRFCLPFDHPQPPVQSGQVAQNAVMFVSPSTDLRFLEMALLNADQISNYSPTGPISGVVALFVGFGSNFLNAIHCENRLVLNNGSHRAYALRDLGITEVPCIIQHVTRREELQVVASGDLAEKPDYYLKHPRPPMLKDYLDDALRSVLPVLRRNRQVKIAFGAETLDSPA